VTDAIAFKSLEVPIDILIRTNKGLMNILGKPITKRDMGRLAIKIMAAPRKPFGKKLGL
jgi:hypothetical protein